ncbi:MAG: hypothetical protein FJZ13_04200 [Candidatus Omnitrophica bacterium]|nr:hypothetical protein [Candidatus Omnitrophota bacterium]
MKNIQVCDTEEAFKGQLEAATKKKAPFGYELLLDLYDCKPGACDDLSLCYKFLDEVVDYLEMEKQAPPNIFFTDGKRFPDKAGLSGWAPLVDSSVVIHTLSPRNYISIDIYCCNEFDVEKAKAFSSRFFSPKRLDAQFVLRGIDYYK